MSDETDINTAKAQATENFRKWFEKFDTQLCRLKWHLSQPATDFRDYSEDKRLALGEIVSKRKKIYLDYNWWIYLTEAKQGKSQPHINQ